MWQHGPIHTLELQLRGEHAGVSVTVHVVEGSDRVAMIDSGISWSYDQLKAFLDDHGYTARLGWLLSTHEHMDHCGNHRRIVNDTGALVAAHPLRADWMRDAERNAREYVLRYPDIAPVFDWREEYWDWIGDEGTPVDIELSEPSTVDLGGVRLEVLDLPGHSPAEIGFYEPRERILVFGDTLMPSHVPNMYLYEDVGQIRASCARIQQFVADHDVAVVLSGHQHPMGPQDAQQWAQECADLTVDIEHAVRETIHAHPGADLGAVRDRVVGRLGKMREWRALITCHAHLRDLQARGLAREHDDGWHPLADDGEGRAPIAQRPEESQP